MANVKLIGLADELAERFSCDVLTAVREFPRDLLRGWKVAESELLGLLEDRAPLGQGTPKWHQFEMELACQCIANLRQSVCELAQDDGVSLQVRVRKIGFYTVFLFLQFLLEEQDPG